MKSELCRIEMLGGLRVCMGDRVIDRFRTRRAAALLARLALLPDRAHPREELIDLLWPDMDEEDGRANLRQALCSLRRLFDDLRLPNGSILPANNCSVRLVAGAITTDVAEFEHALAKADEADSESIDNRARAIDLYRGELMSGFYDEWILPERRRLESRYAAALHEQQQALVEIGEPLRALPYALRAIQIDPCNEEAHLAAMRLYATIGDSASVRRQIDQLDQILRDNLGEPPTEETRHRADSLIAEANVMEESQRQRAAANALKRMNGPPTMLVPARSPLRHALAGFAAFACLALVMITPALRPQRSTAAGSLVLTADDQEVVELRKLRTGPFIAGTNLERRETRRRHAQICIVLAERAWNCWYGRDEEKWLDRFTEANEELRSALRWLLDNDPEEAVRLCGDLARFWYVRGFSREGYEWLRESLASAPAIRSAARARALVGCAFLSPPADAMDESQYQEALAIFRECGDRWGEAHALRHLGFLACSRARFGAALNFYRQALDLFTALKSDRGRAVTLLCISFVVNPSFAGQNRKMAADHAREGLELFKRLENPWGISMALHSLGMLESDRARARSLLQQAIEAYPEANGLSGKESEERARMALTRGDFKRARDYYKDSIRMCRERNDKNGVAFCISQILLMPSSDAASDARLLGAGEALYRRLGIDNVQTLDAYREHIAPRLGQLRFEAAKREGERLSWEEAVDLAVSLN